MESADRKVEINGSAGKLLKVLCLQCKHDTTHQVLASADITEDLSDGQHQMDGWGSYQVIVCQGCETVSYRTSTAHSEDYDAGPDGLEYNQTITLYPSRTEGRMHIPDAHIIPASTKRIYDEIIKAMNNDQPVLTGIGIRALVETVCKDKKTKGKNLAEQIDDLVTIGALPRDGAVILHKIRTLGNKAAHEVKPHTPEQLGLALTVCEHLLQGVYILPKHASRTFK
jgi:Domain of unknown function (DUF4145)